MKVEFNKVRNKPIHLVFVGDEQIGTIQEVKGEWIVRFGAEEAPHRFSSGTAAQAYVQGFVDGETEHERLMLEGSEELRDGREAAE